MGLVILPLLFVSILVILVAVVLVAVAIYGNKFHWASVLVGALVSTVIYALFYMKYRGMTKIYAFDPVFDFPIYLIILPFLVGLVLRFFKIPLVTILSDGLFTGVVLSGLFMVFFSKYTLGIIEFLGKETTH